MGIQLCTMTRTLSEAPDQQLLAQLRGLERQMGLVLTLVSVLVWQPTTFRRLSALPIVQSVTMGRGAGREYNSCRNCFV